MPRRGARTKIAPCIYKDRTGYAVQVRIGSGATRKSIEKRFPLGTRLEVLKTERDEARAQLRKARPAPRGRLATFADDVEEYIARPSRLESPETRRAELAAWVKVIGQRRRADITTEDLDEVLGAWFARGVSPHTLNHRRNAAIQLWAALDGRQAPNPARQTAHFRTDSGRAAEIPQDALAALIAAMPKSKARAFYRLFAETGWPPARIRRIERDDVDWKGASVYLVDRRKGKGTPGRAFPLSRRGLEALREFHALDAYGGVVRATVLVVFRRAQARVNAGRALCTCANRLPAIPDDVVPYHARHTIGAQIFRRTGDIYGTAEFLGVSVETALRYARAAVPDRMRAAADALDALRGGGTPRPTTPGRR